MAISLEKHSDLKSRIDKIVSDESGTVSGLYGDSAVAVQHLMWRCGLEVVKDYPDLERGNLPTPLRGVWAGLSKVERETGRKRETIKKWVDLVLRVGKTKKEWEVYAEKERIAATNRFLNGMKGKDKLIESEPENIEVQEDDSWPRWNEDFSTVDPGEQIDLILTDPPYGIDFKDTWTNLAIWAKKYLKPNGFLVSYFGELNLPDFYSALSSQLDYYWTFALIHKANKQLIMPRNVFCGWKPILVYQNGFRRLKEKIEDIIAGSGREKGDHEWQQGESEIEPIIESFTRPGMLVCDPFMGSGTTLRKAKDMKRRIMGMEIDIDTFKGAVRRINE